MLILIKAHLVTVLHVVHPDMFCWRNIPLALQATTFRSICRTRSENTLALVVGHKHAKRPVLKIL